jgi:hypothetical protein
MNAIKYEIVVSGSRWVTCETPENCTMQSFMRDNGTLVQRGFIRNVRPCDSAQAELRGAAYAAQLEQNPHWTP